MFLSEYYIPGTTLALESQQGTKQIQISASWSRLHPNDLTQTSLMILFNPYNNPEWEV